ncbi:MAG: thioredoxin-dependent thiol peroxidase [Magnetovibrio sp.]|nr:thioredoxin-dependent thiol peroxidase [Magnetovibrio sp.]
MVLKIGDKAPRFSLPTDSGEILSLNELRGQRVVLYFYPKNMTPGCTSEAVDFRDYTKDFNNAGALIIGVSKETVVRHKNFKTKYNLNFTLISDEKGTLCEAYGVWKKKKLYGREFMGIVRTTFLIDSFGIVQKIWPKVKVKGHAEEVLAAIQS